jgi:hypothetical protein
MQTVLNPLVNVYQTQLEASRRFADAVFSGTEKIDRIVLDAVHRIFNQQLTLVQAMTTASDPQAAAALLQTKLMPRSPDETMNYQKEVMRVFAEMQNDISRSLQDYMEQLGSTAAAGVALPQEASMRQANDAAYNPVTSVFSAWESAFKEAAALAQKNMVGTRSAFEDAASRTIESAAVFSRESPDGPGNADALSHAAGSSRSSRGNDDGPGGDRRGGPSGKRKL